MKEFVGIVREQKEKKFERQKKNQQMPKKVGTHPQQHGQGEKQKLSMIITATSPTTISLRHPTPIQLEIWDPVRKKWDTAAQTTTLTNEGVIITLTGLVPNTEYRVQCKGSEETVGVKTQGR